MTQIISFKERLSSKIKTIALLEGETAIDATMGPGPQVSVDQEKIGNICDRMDKALVTIFKAHEFGKYDFNDQEVNGAYGEISCLLEVLRAIAGIGNDLETDCDC